MFKQPKPHPWTKKITQWFNEELFFPKAAKVKKFHLFFEKESFLDSKKPYLWLPNHPEFFTDWALDKLILDRFQPKTLSWAAPFILKGPAFIQSFWSQNGLIPAVKNKADGSNPAIDFSVSHLQENGSILMHPEGAVNWIPQHVGKIRKGAFNIAEKYHESTKNPLQCILVSSFYRFEKSVSLELIREQDWIAKKWNIQLDNLDPLVKRLRYLCEYALTKQALRWSQEFLPSGHLPAFKRSSNWMDDTENWAMNCLDFWKSQGMFPPETQLSEWKKIAFKTESNDPKLKKAVALLMSILRLQMKEMADKMFLSEEEIASWQKRLREDHVHENILDEIRKMMPFAIAPRQCFVVIQGPMDMPCSDENETSLWIHQHLQKGIHQAMEESEKILGKPFIHVNFFEMKIL